MFEVQIMERGSEIGTFDLDELPVVGKSFDLFGETMEATKVTQSEGYWIVEVKFITEDDDEDCWEVIS